ncbi:MULTISPECIES: hypothetical protein [unclassified Oscillibacter]|uniref:Ppx/GppA phosphatase family protein n=1 Tax=unclassified Oscillibacter TaxID=2629304 RepID=UPI0025FBE204|nr:MULTISPECIES: hypothetical protein [unclassified Oscillibacter]
MKQAMIDIGSNSMRLTVYETEGNSFKILFREKSMAGLAGYVENGTLSDEGILCACRGLLKFKKILTSLDIQDVVIFATASLRNISNTEEAVSAIRDHTGWEVEVISGEEEALYGYTGAMLEFQLSRGAVLDIGGASTELALFNEDRPLRSLSLPIGSLNLYRSCVKKILPGRRSLKKIRETIQAELDRSSLPDFERQLPLVCVGGTGRAVLKLAGAVYAQPEGCRAIGAEQLDGLCAILCRGDRQIIDLILKLSPDRIHTIVPGILVLHSLFHLLDAKTLEIGKYGVRERYLCRKIL